MATVVSMKALLESGVHFGHRTNKWDPRMRPFIFTERNGIHIIDLQQTVKSLNTAYNVVRDCVQEGGTVLFVGTKRQAQETVREEATRCGMPYVTERWMGGILTNWNTMYQRVQELERLEHMRDTGEIHRLTKKEGLLVEREISRLEIRLSGLRKMKRLPDYVFIVDVCRETTAVHEANKLTIPIIALVDTNCDPTGVDYVIPSNDDAIRAIKLLVGKVADAVLEGRAMRKDEEPDYDMAAPAVSSRPSRLPREGMELEEDLDDAELLGEATLAKLSSQRAAEEEAAHAAEVAPAAEVEVAPAVEEEAVPAAEEEAAAEPVVEEAAPAAEADEETSGETEEPAAEPADKE